MGTTEVRKRPGERAAACGGRARRAREAHRAARRELARLVRRVHGCPAGQDGSADVRDDDVIVIGGGSPASTVPGRSQKVACVSRLSSAS
jgi:hypothetical protein